MDTGEMKIGEINISDGRIIQKMIDLRFVERDGKRILQQRYFWFTNDGDSGDDWQEVPLVSEGD